VQDSEFVQDQASVDRSPREGTILQHTRLPINIVGQVKQPGCTVAFVLLGGSRHSTSR